MSFEQDPAGPQAFRDFLPLAVQGVLGVQTSQGAPQDDISAGVDALQLFMGGPIARNVSIYAHHHIILENEPGPLHEAQLRVDQPGGLPVSFRVGKFEPWLANSPGKTILTHNGYNPINVSVGLNNNTAGQSRFGGGMLWFLGDSYRVDVELTYNDGPEAFARPFYKLSNGGEIGLVMFAGRADYQGTLASGTDVGFTDAWGRLGADFALYATNWLELGGLVLWNSHTNPDGSDSATRYGSGYLQAELFPVSWFAGVLRYEHVQYKDQPETIYALGQAPAAVPAGKGGFLPLHGGEGAVAAGPGAPDLNNWIVGSAQAYLRENVKFQLEYRLDLQDTDASSIFLGTHFAF